MSAQQRARTRASSTMMTHERERARAQTITSGGDKQANETFHANIEAMRIDVCRVFRACKTIIKNLSRRASRSLTLQTFAMRCCALAGSPARLHSLHRLHLAINATIFLFARARPKKWSLLEEANFMRDNRRVFCKENANERARRTKKLAACVCNLREAWEKRDEKKLK